MIVAADGGWELLGGMAADTTTTRGNDLTPLVPVRPASWRHVKTRVIVGVATFFDAFDTLAIASVLPALVPLWKLTVPQASVLVSAGFAGQFAGAVFFGWIADRYGRLPALAWSLGIFAVVGFICAFAWNYDSLVVLRTIQGIGLGGTVPVAAVYVTELAGAKHRGRFVMLYQLAFPIGIAASSAIGFWVVPRFGWQYMFVAGALPAILALYLRRLLPESPHWLARQERNGEADGSATARPLLWADVFGPEHLRRTLAVWAIWIAASFCTYGFAIWPPILYRMQFGLPLDVSLRYGLTAQLAGLIGAALAALLIDRIGRKAWFALAFAGATVALGGLSLDGMPTAAHVLAYVSVAYFFVGGIAVGVYVYTAELYPARARGRGVGAASAGFHLVSIAAPVVVGTLVAADVQFAFLAYALAAAMAAAVTALFAVETAGRPLDGTSH